MWSKAGGALNKADPCSGAGRNWGRAGVRGGDGIPGWSHEHGEEPGFRLKGTCLHVNMATNSKEVTIFPRGKRTPSQVAQAGSAMPPGHST